ncbi:MAG: sugar phosphate isomerase/epimerase [Brevinematales bacterium]|nr:sugar phosphate isomerase/epimerase [Brevinematales bacterium]
MYKKIGIKIPGTNSKKGLKKTYKFLEYIEKIGYRAIEIRPDDFDLIEYGNINEKFLKELSKIIEVFEFDISVHVPIRLNLFNDEQSEIHKKVLYSSLEICKFLGSKILVYHPGRYIDNVEFPRLGKPNIDNSKKKELLEIEKDILSSLARNYKEITIAMENHRPYLDFSPYSYAEFIDELISQVKRINEKNVKIALDTGHLNLSANYHNFDLLKSAKEAEKYTVHLHIQDNHGITNFYTEKDKAEMLPFGRGDEHIVPGRGNFPFKEFFEIFKNFEGIYTIELSSRYLIKEKIKEAYDYLNDLI